MKFYIFFTSLAVQLSVFSQNTGIGIVRYGHKQSFGMGQSIGVDYNAELVFDAINSTYTFAKDSLENGRINKMDMMKNQEKIFFVQKGTTETGFLYNINLETKLIKSRDIGFNYINDTIPKINWKILREEKRIGNFNCTKATCNFRGRLYTAWFSLDIPLPYGPWKLQGLPGLILEAYDNNKEILFYFKSIEYPTKKQMEITVPNPKTNNDMEKNRPTLDRVWISFEDYKREIIKRHEIGTKMGRMFMQQIPNTLDVENKNPMRNVYIEIFDEE